MKIYLFFILYNILSKWYIQLCKIFIPLFNHKYNIIYLEFINFMIIILKFIFIINLDWLIVYFFYTNHRN